MGVKWNILQGEMLLSLQIRDKAISAIVLLRISALLVIVRLKSPGKSMELVSGRDGVVCVWEEGMYHLKKTTNSNSQLIFAAYKTNLINSEMENQRSKRDLFITDNILVGFSGGSKLGWNTNPLIAIQLLKQLSY